MSFMKKKKDMAPEAGSADDLAIAMSARKACKPKKMAAGGPVAASMDDGMTDADEHYSSIADAILKKKRKMADGGMVDISENAQESGQTPFAEMNGEAYLKELYDDSQLDDEPMDSIGDPAEDDEENDHDAGIVSKIRRKYK